MALTRQALIVVDVQNDFCPGGALEVGDGDLVVPVLNEYAKHFSEHGAPVYASRDWHPAESRHFREFGGVWPRHCVQGTPGAQLHPGLVLPGGTEVVDKGENPDDDAYSAFQARTRNGADLERSLRERGVEHVYVGGLATDYCVKSTVLDALSRGFGATLLIDACRGVNVRPHDSEEAIIEMTRAGAEVATVEQTKKLWLPHSTPHPRRCII